MDVTVVYFDGCPHWRGALARAREALRSVAPGADVRLVRVVSERDAERIGFRGSPTILVNGRDPFVAGEGGPGFRCRLYLTPEGMQGAPSVSQIRDVLDADR